MIEVIATRTFWWEDDKQQKVLISIGKPLPSGEGHDDYYCPVRATGLGNDDYVQRIFGVDAFQALELAMRYVGYRISDIDAKSGGKLRWAYTDDNRIPADWALKPE